MKKLLLTLAIIFAPALTVMFFILQQKKDTSVIVSPKSSTAIISHKTEDISPQPRGVLFKEFNLPDHLRREIAEAERNGDIKDGWGEGKVSIDELEKAGLTSNQFSQVWELDKKIKNITAGFSLPAQTFAQNLNDCLPDKETTAQVKILNSEALSAMGFSALMENNYLQAQQAFTALINNYADTQPAPLAYLELARLIFQQGHFSEAKDLINKALFLYGEDKEYLIIAQSLKEEMEANE